MSKEKTFSEKEVKKKIKKVLKLVEVYKLDGCVFKLSKVLGDYQFNSHNRHIKEVVFESSENFGSSGARWYLRYPKNSAGKLAKKVMKFSLHDLYYK